MGEYEQWENDYHTIDMNAFRFYIPKYNPSNRLYVRTMIDGFALHKDNIDNLSDVLGALIQWNNEGTILNFDEKFPANVKFIKKHPDSKLYFTLPIWSIFEENLIKLLDFCDAHFWFEDVEKGNFIYDYDMYYYQIDPNRKHNLHPNPPTPVKDIIKDTKLTEIQNNIDDTPFNILEERICSYVRLILFLNELDCEYSITLRNIVKAIKNELEIISNNDILIQYVPSHNGEDMKHELIPTTEYGEKILNRVTMEWEDDVLNDLLVLNEELKLKKKSENEEKVRKPISGRVRQNVLMRDNYTCQICGATVKDGAKLEIDHIKPVSKGGTNDENNLQVLCQQCNREKHNRDDLLHDKRKLAELEGK